MKKRSSFHLVQAKCTFLNFVWFVIHVPRIIHLFVLQVGSLLSMVFCIICLSVYRYLQDLWEWHLSQMEVLFQKLHWFVSFYQLGSQWSREHLHLWKMKNTQTHYNLYNQTRNKKNSKTFRLQCTIKEMVTFFTLKMFQPDYS